MPHHPVKFHNCASWENTGCSIFCKWWNPNHNLVISPTTITISIFENNFTPLKEISHYFQLCVCQWVWCDLFATALIPLVPLVIDHICQVCICLTHMNDNYMIIYISILCYISNYVHCEWTVVSHLRFYTMINTESLH